MPGGRFHVERAHRRPASSVVERQVHLQASPGARPPASHPPTNDGSTAEGHGARGARRTWWWRPGRPEQLARSSAPRRPTGDDRAECREPRRRQGDGPSETRGPRDAARASLPPGIGCDRGACPRAGRRPRSSPVDAAYQVAPDGGGRGAAGGDGRGASCGDPSGRPGAGGGRRSAMVAVDDHRGTVGSLGRGSATKRREVPRGTPEGRWASGGVRVLTDPGLGPGPGPGPVPSPWQGPPSPSPSLAPVCHRPQVLVPGGDPSPVAPPVHGSSTCSLAVVLALAGVPGWCPALDLSAEARRGRG
jgi:hypothetical protein